MAKYTGHTITDDSALGGKVIERSVRLNESDNPYFNRTATVAGDRRTFTLSIWVKFYKIEGNQDFIFMCGDSPSNQLQLSREGNAQINFEPKTGGSTDARFYTSSKFRDNSWYHFVLKIDSTQGTASDRMAFYINGVQDNEDSAIVATTYPSQNLEFKWGQNGISYVIGRRTHSGYEGSGDMQIADAHYVSGYAYEPTEFGYFDDQTGIWRPKKYTGSYGSAGWHLEFKDSSAIGKDTSGNGNDFTTNNVSAHDVLIDTPTNQFATLRTHSTPEASGVALAEGNLKYTTGSTGGAGTLNRIAISTFLPTSGKWYAEVIPTSGAGNQCAGIVPYTVEETPTTDRPRYNIVNFNTGEILKNLSGSGATDTYGASISTNDVLCIYMDMDAKTVYYGKNGQWANGSGAWNQSTPTSGSALGNSFFNYKTGGHEGFAIAIMSVTGGASITCIANFGQDSTFGGTLSAGGNKDDRGIGDFKYPVPSGALALCSKNMPLTAPTILRPQKHFETVTYSGTGSTNKIESLEFAPDLVWVKRRDSNRYHIWTDTVRGAGNYLVSNTNDAESSGGSQLINAFFKNGFQVGTEQAVNNASGTYVAWCWKAGGAAVSNSDGSITTSISANQEAGFSIVTWTGTGSNSTVGHGLGKAPKWIICKLRDTTTQDWFFNVGEITGDRGKYMKFNDSGGIVSDIHTFPPTAATSTVFTVGGEDGGNSSNGNGSKYVAYCWAEIPGYSKIGSYVGNGNANGTFVHLGFRPAWVIVKKSTDDNWPIYDYKRDPHNVGDHRLFADTDTAEGAVGQEHIDFLSNGFKWRRDKNPFNDSGSTYFYMALARQPGLTPYDTFPNAR